MRTLKIIFGTLLGLGIIYLIADGNKFDDLKNTGQLVSSWLIYVLTFVWVAWLIYSGIYFDFVKGKLNVLKILSLSVSALYSLAMLYGLSVVFSRPFSIVDTKITVIFSLIGACAIAIAIDEFQQVANSKRKQETK